MHYFTPLCLLIVAIIWHIVIFRLSPKLGLVKLNFCKRPIMASYGIVSFPYIAAATVSLTMLGYVQRGQAVLHLAVMGAMWVLGALDDILGSREVGGFKGHFKKLLFERKLTTGAAKALGGGVVGLVAGYYVSGGDPLRWVLAALVVPLSANILNLVDLRPGRAVAVLFLGLGVTYILALGALPSPWIVAAIVVVSLVWGIVDARGLAMMGDSGSNALGAALGLTIVTSTPAIAQVAAIVVFVAIHWYSEKHSISALIERHAVLRAIDARLGVR